MKKLLTVLLFLSVWASATQITGTVRGSDGNRFNGTVNLYLSQPTQNAVTGEVIVPTVRSFSVNNGIISSSSIVVPNDQMQPQGTYYVAEYIDPYGNLDAQFNYYVTSDNATWDVGQATPTTVTTQNVSYANIPATNKSNTWTSPQTMKIFNGVYNPFAYAGSDFGTQINAAILAAPSGAVIDGRQYNGSTLWTTQIVITKPVRLLLCGVNATFTSAAIANGLIQIQPGADGTVIDSTCPSGRNAQVTKFTVTPSSGTQDIISIGTNAASQIIQHITVRGLGIVANANVRDFVVQQSCGTQHVIEDNNLEGPGTGYTSGYVYNSGCNNTLAENDQHQVMNNMSHKWGRGIQDGVSTVGWYVHGNRWLNMSGSAASLSKSSNVTLDGNAFTFINETNADAGAIVLTGGLLGVNNVRISNNHFENNGGSSGAGVDIKLDTNAGYNTFLIDNNRFYAGTVFPAAKAIYAVGFGNRQGVILRNEFDSQTACAMDLFANIVDVAVEDSFIMNSDRATVKFCGAGAGDAGKHIDGSLFVENTPAAGSSLYLPNNRPIQLKDAGGTYRAFISPGADNYVRFYPLAATGFLFRNFANTQNRFAIDDATGQINSYGVIDSLSGYNVNGTPLSNSTRDVTANSLKVGASGSVITDTRELIQSLHGCGTTTTCANSANGSFREIFGTVTLAAGTANVTGISPAFTSVATWFCTTTDLTALAASKCSPTSGSAMTCTGTTTDVIAYSCKGN